MKVALVILHGDPLRGGAERYTYDLAVALGKAGHEVDVVSTTCSGTAPISRSCSPIPFREVVFPSHGFSKLGQYRRFLDAVELHLDTTTYDVVHAMLPVRRCDVYHPHAGIAADAVRTGHRKHASPVTRTAAALFNRANLKRGQFARVERALLGSERPPVVLCLSDYVKETVRRRYPSLSKDHLVKLFNAARLDRFDPSGPVPDDSEDSAEGARRLLSPPPGAVVGLMIAQDFERKGLREAIAALAGAGDPRLHLAVVGKPDPTAYRDLARSLGVADRVHLLGPTIHVRAFYAAADFFVLPTRHDPCSLVVLEALAMGLPVISTRQNGACEIMADGVQGFVLRNADDHDGLVAAMRAMTDDAARARMREACLALRPALAYETHVATLLDVYHRVAGQKTRAGGHGAT